MATTKAYRKGYTAYGEAKYPKDNPYSRKNQTDRRDWLRGWRDALMSDPLLDQDEKHELLKQTS